MYVYNQCAIRGLSLLVVFQSLQSKIYSHHRLSICSRLKILLHRQPEFIHCCWRSGASIPLRPLCIFPPCFRLPPLFSENFRTLRNIFTILPFPEQISSFSSAKISD